MSKLSDVAGAVLDEVSQSGLRADRVRIVSRQSVAIIEL
jgi:hypothetical protein